MVFICVRDKSSLLKKNSPKLDVADIPIKMNFPSYDPLI
jgi:hypothetical protein